MGTRITIEFFGIPRQRAGRSQLEVEAGTVAEALRAAQSQCPGLHGVVQGNRIAPHYRVSVNGERFVTEPNEKLAAGDRVLILSADVGG